MRKGISSLVIVGVAACVALYAITAPSSTQLNTSPAAVELDFMRFVSKYGKSYATKEEYDFRLNLFRSTLSKII